MHEYINVECMRDQREFAIVVVLATVTVICGIWSESNKKTKTRDPTYLI